MAPSHVGLGLFSVLAAFCLAHGCEQRDYTGKCPEGWQPGGVAKCIAPLSYGGPCPSSATIGFYNDAMKQQFAAKCGVAWPCLDCTRDYSQTCPTGWLHMGRGICAAPLAYEHHCSKQVHMTTEQFKRSFSAECSVYWPCRSTCGEQDFEQDCPQFWESYEGVCKAPADRSYVGPCAPFANLQGLTAQDKAQYAALCQVQFPCQSDAPAVPECEPSEAPCPKGWLRKGSSAGVCHGMEYEGPCRPVITEERLASIGKATYMETCGVEWDCALEATGSTLAAGTGRIHSGPVSPDGRIVGPNL